MQWLQLSPEIPYTHTTIELHRYAVAIKGECEEGLWKQLQLMTAAPQMQQPSTPGQTNAEATNSYLLQIQKTAVSIVRNVNELFKRQ